MDAIEYIKRFAIKHKFKGDCTVARKNHNGDSYITGILLDKEDCSIDKNISMDDIIFDIESNLPEDCFQQWMEYRMNVEDISFQQWISSGAPYIPTGVDTSNLSNLKDELMGYINAVGQDIDKRWGLEDDSDWEEDEEWEYQ